MGIYYHGWLENDFDDDRDILAAPAQRPACFLHATGQTVLLPAG